MTPILVGLDPGLATCGAAIVELLPRPRVLDFRVFTSKPSAKKHGILEGEDTTARAILFGKWLRGLVAAQPRLNRTIIAIATESRAHLRSAQASGKLSLAFGVMLGLAVERELPVHQVDPQAVKLAICRNRAASKKDIIAAVLSRCPEVSLFRSDITESLWEHPHDAVAVALTVIDAPAVQMALRAMGAGNAA